MGEITMIKTEETTKPISVEIVKDEITLHLTDTVEIVSEHEAKTITPLDDSSIVKTVDTVTTKFIEKSEDTSTDVHLETKEPVVVEDIKSTKDTKSDEKAKDTDYLEEEVLAATESLTKVIEVNDAQKQITEEDIISKHLPIDKLDVLEIVDFKTNEEMVKGQSKDGVALEEEHVHDMTELLEPIDMDTVSEITIIKTEETTTPISVEIVKDEITTHVTDTVEIVSEHEAKTITPVDDSSIVKTVDKVTTKVIEESEDTSTDDHLKTKEPVSIEDIKSTKDTKSVEEAKDTDSFEEEVLADTESPTKVIEADDAPKHITKEDIINKHLPIDKLESLEIVGSKTTEEMVKDQSKEGVPLEEEHVHDMTDLFEPIARDTVSEITIMNTEGTTTPISLEIVKDEITTHVTDTVEIVSEHKAKTVTAVYDSSIVKTVDTVNTKVIEESEYTSTDVHLELKEPVPVEDIKFTKDTKSDEEAKDTDSLEEEVLADTESPKIVIEADDAPKQITEEDIISKHLPMDKLESLEIVGFKTTEEMVKDQSKDGAALEEEHVHDMTEIVKDEITTHVTDTVEIVSKHKAETNTSDTEEKKEATPVYDVDDSSIVKTTTKVIEESDNTTTDFHLETKDPVAVEDIKSAIDVDETKDTDFLEEELFADSETLTKVIEADDASKQITEEDIISKHLPVDKLKSLEIEGFKTTEEMVKEKLKDGVALEEEHIHDVTELLQPIARDTVSVIKSEETPIPISVEIVKEEITTSVTDTVDKSFSTAEIAQLSNEPILESDNLTDDTSVRSADISWQESVKSSLNFTPELYTGQNSFSSIESFQLHSNTSGDTESSVCSPQASSFHRKKVKTSTLTHCYESDTEATTSDLVLSDKLLFSDTTASELTDVETDSSLPYSIKDTTKTMVVDDIKMTDDVIEVTVSTEDQQYDKSNLSDDSEAYYKGKLINTESGSNIVMLESLSGKSICICDSVSSETDFPIDSGSSQPQTRTKPHTDAKKAFKEKSRPDIKPKPKYNSKYDHIESKIKKEFKSSIARKSYKSTTDDISSSSTSTSKNALSPKHRPIERKSNSAGQYKQKPSNNVVEKQQKPEPDIESKDRTSKISEQKYSSRSRGYMASTLSRDMKLESAPKETALKSPKHISKRHKSIERKSESSSTVSTPKTIKIQQSSISSSKHEEISSHKFKALTTMRKREPLKKKVTNSETTKSITLSNKQEKFQSEISKLKHNEKENKIKVSSSGHSKPALTNISSRSTQRLNKSALLPSTDAPLKQKRRLVDQTKQTMTTFKKKDTAESARTDELKTGPSTSSGKDTDSLSKVTKQNTKRLDVTKYQKTFEDTRKASSRDQTFKAQKTQNQLKKSEQTVEIHKSELEDVSTTALPSVSESLSLCSTTIHRSTIVGAESNIDDSLKMRAASAPISSSNIFMDPDIHLSSRRGSGPTRCLISGRIMERHTSLDQSKGPTSLPSSPSRMRSQGQCNSIQLLTSEVFTRTVDSTSGIEVIFHQPNDPVRKPAKSEHYPNDVGETSMIDTTDSSLSDSVALPSSSSDHDLSVDTSYRLRTSISPGSPKISRRSRESMSPKIRQTDIVECATVLEDDTSETEISPDRNSPNLIACDRQLSTPTKLYDKSDNNRAPASSEDRFSPILNVRSITPPRLKHKFVYASSDEEEPSIGKTLLEDESSASNVVMEPSSDHSMLLPSEIPDSSLSETVNTYRPSLVKELDLPLAITDKIVSVQSFEDDFHCEELITETTSSDIDKALLESIKFKSSSEEEATDKDPDPIPSDDILINEIINHHIKDRHQTSLIHNQIMAGKDSSIPLISITNTDENVIHTEINIDPYQKSQDPLTDIEDLDVGPEDRNPRNLKINVIEDGDVTDAEIVEASDDEKDLDCIPKISFQLNDIIDHSGTYEELVRMSSPTSKQSKSNIESSFTTSNTPQLGDFLKLFYERDGTTDYEDMDLSDEEDNADEMGENTENDEVLQRLMDDGTVSISDSVKKSPIPSPSVTPEPGQKRNYKKGKAAKKSSSGLRSKADYNLLSPRSLSPHLSDITDTEVVYSDSDEEERMKKQRPLSPQERRKRLRQLKEIEHDRRKMKDEEERDVLPELEISSVQISEKVPVKEVVSESDTDNTNYVHPKHITYAPKKRTLLMEVAGALMKETLVSTDVEHFEGSNESDDDAASQISEDRTSGTENQFFSIKEKEVSKHALSLPKQDRVVLTDTEDIETEEEFAKASTSKPVIKVSTEASTEEDDFEPTENEYLSAVREMRARAWKDNNYEIHFIEIDGKTRPLAITPDLPVVCHSLKLNTLEKPLYVTDMEDLADSDLETAQNFLPVATVHSDAVLTDTEFVEGDEETFRPKSPEPSDDENSQPLPEPVREMILMKEDPSGRPVSVVLPLGNVSPGGLKPPHLELEGGISEVEDIATDDDDLTNPSFARDLGPTPDLPEIEGGIIHFSEVMKVQKKKLKVTGQEVQEPLTDTEDLFLSVSGKRKRTKTKMKLGLEPTPCNIKQDLTDTEDILLSDVENRQGNILTVPSTEIDPTTDLDDIDISGEEDEHDHQRQMALTPDHLRELGDSYITLKEGNGPFSEEAKQSFLSLHKIPIINTISPSPDIQFLVNTDTEDMFTSADEEGFSRAETITPYEGAIELEDHSSVVYMKHTRKFDLDAPEEAIHVKGGIDIHETLTDIEDLGVSEDERPKPPDQLFVNDTTDQVCVCLTTKTNYEDSVCVCVNKEHGGLALVWNSKNSTDAKHQRDWAEKGGPDSPIDATKREVSKDVTPEQETTEADIIPPKPSPRPTKQDSQDHSNNSQKTNNDIQDYSVRKKFWEQMSSGSQDSQKSQEISPSPVPKPRSSIVSSVPLLKSEAESDTETTATTLSDSTIRIKSLQQDAVSKQSLTGSSESSEKDESETEATENKNSLSDFNIPSTTPFVYNESEVKKHLTRVAENSDSETEYVAKVGDDILTYESSGFILDDEAGQITPKPNDLESSGIGKPVVSSRKGRYERSTSLPTENITDISTSSVKARKQFFETQIKKEMVVDQLMTQLEEESSPEHKSFYHKASDVPTSDPEVMVSRQIHSHIFSHELEEQIESLIPENKQISEQTEEIEPIKSSSVKEVVNTFDKVDAKRCVKRTDSISYEVEIVENKQYSIENVEDLKTDYSKTDKNLKESDNETYNLQIVKHKLTDEFEGFDTSQSKTKIYEEVADIIRYRSDSISKPSESLEVHIDKSEIEESEKEMEIDEELKQLEEGLIQRSKSDLYYRDDEFLPQITVTQSKLRPDSYSQGESEDTQSESDITPEDIREKESVSKFQDWEQEIHSVETLDKNEFCQSPIPPHVHTPEEHIPDTVWEVPIQQEPESSEQEIVEDIPIEKQPILEKDEEESQRSLTESCEMKSEILQRLENSTSHRLSDNESSLTESVLDLKSGVKEQNSECKLTEDEARIIAQEVVENIEIEISKRPQLLTDDIDMNVTSETVDAINNSEVSEYIKRLTGKEDLEVKLIESVLAKKQREQIIKLSRNDTTTSSMEITDEDLRSSGVETDNSPLESQGSRLYPIENNGEDDSTKHIQNNELDLDGVTETSKNKAVLEKTLAEVKESLEAAQDELIEEQKKKKEVHKKPSPSEFEFKALALEKYADAYIQECEIEEAATGFDLEHVVENELNLESSKLSLKEKNEVKNESHADISQSINVVKSEIRIDNRSLDFENKHLTHEETEFIHRTDSSGAKDMKDITKESASYLVCENKDSHLESHQISSFATSAFTSNIDVEQSKEGRGPLEQDFTHSFYKEEHVAEAQLKIGTGNLEKTKCSSISIDKEDTLTFDDNSLKNNYLESKSKDSLMLINETNENYQFESKTQSSTTSGIHQEDSESSLKIKLKNLYLEEEAVVDSVLQKDEIKRTNSEESQKSSQDESFRSHTGIEGGISSSSSSGKKEDSDAAMHTLGQPEVTMRKRKADKSSSHKRSERRSGTDYEPYSSSGESYYQSLEQTSESIRTPSRPCSSDVDALVAGVGTTGSSEYESAFSHEMSARSLTSYEYHTAVSSLSSRDSMKSLDSESSGNLASVEISSEASETLVPSAMELDSDMEGLTMNIIEEDCFFKHKPILEPYDQDIPHHIIKGEPPPRIHTLSDLKEYGKSISLDISSEGGVSEEDGEASLSVSKDEDVLDKSSRMKRSHEMTFQPEPRPITFDVGSESFSCEERLGSSLEDSASIISASSTSDPTAVLTIIERSRTESDKMDGSANSDQLSLTVSGTSEQISLSSVCDDMNVHQIVSCETIATQSLNNESRVESVLLMTSSVNADGIQSVSTQVTSQTEIPPTKIDEIVEDGYTCSNGPTQVEYNAEYDEIKEVKRRPGHRRNESTSFKPSLIPVLKKKDVETKIQKNVTSDFDDDVAESDKYKNVTSLTLKEDRNDEKKDVDETEKVYEESFQTEADQGFHRDMREARQAYEDMSSLEEEHEDLQNITESRPHSQISKSDSESGQRPISSVFSDDRPDSELAELLKQCSSDVCSEDPIERPKTPEPLEDCEIKDDTPEFSSEAQASVTELELEYSGAVSRTLEYEDHVSPIREKVSSHWEHSTLEHEEELAEAEAAFHMVPHVIPHLGGVPHPDTILEDPVAEKHELETREMLLKEEIRKRIAKAEATSPGSIPDITITQHMTPLIDRGFHYPDLELEEADAKASAPQTPASISSRASTETETDQGNEYVLGDDIGEDFITEEPDIGESSVTTEEKTVFESKDDFHERGSATDSPTSDSFEMLEKPDIADEFVIIEEVGKEAHEQDMEGKSMAIGKKRIIKKNVDTEDIVVVSPPAPVTRMTEIKYYPEGGAAFPFESDSPPTNMDGAQSGEGTSQEGSPPSDIEQEYESEVEAGKKWIEMQFQGDQATAVYGYELDYERGPLEDIKEEPDLENNSSRFGSLGSQVSQSAGSFGSMKESFSSTPDYDVLAGRKYFTKSGEHDDVSMSSLQEFERLENLIAMEINRNKSSGSQDSLNSSGNSKRHTGSGKSGGDDVSLASLKEFEGLEHACIEAAKIELKAKEEEAALLSEIEEGHESQASESESCETISAGGIRGGDSDEEDYEKRMFEIDEIIRQAQNNVERFIDVKEKDSLVESSVIEKTESMGRGDSIEEVSKIPDLDLDQPLHSLATTSALTQLHTGPATQQWKEKGSDTIICVSSKHFSDNITTSTDSLEIKTFNERDNMSASTDSIEFQAQQKMLKSKDIMTDSIEVPGDKTSMLTSTDSLETDNAKCFSDSMDDEDGGHNTALQDQSSSSGREGDFSFSSKDDFLEQNRMPPSRSDLLLGSTDSLEPSSSTATNATYHCENDSVMSSSFTSVGSNTLMSSTETLDTGLRTAVWFDDCKPFVTEVIEPCEEGDGFVHTIHRTVEMPPEIHNVTFKGSDADRALKEYIEQFGPGEDVTETQEIDAAGNVHTIRVVQKRVVMKPDDLKNPNSRLSESEIDEYLKLTCDERNTTSESRKETPMFTSSPAQQFLPHQTITQIISQSPKQELISSLVKGETTGEEAEGVPSSAATRGSRPPLKYDISMDEEPEFDPREHDWRFNLPTYSETEEALADLAAGIQDNKGSSSGADPSNYK
ncbi:uncharacterized protein LOC128983229 isoform X3 [Macrosteles quadrilineatus]|uniref:uncharacterized protein LOC128983229 isoform X3 n=1 Tax=Macrosteles quadrilineatus TaxID=74068 RepID=UPI0023E2C0B9|nr:uncharacterized protein LOC128983229 isoform X3 [Macrosteles quadrilineatus]